MPDNTSSTTSHYSGRHRQPARTSKARRRVVGAGVTGVATIAAGIATSSSAEASGSSVWDRVAACESGGNWSINTGNGFYGGLQFTHSTWIAYGGGRYANNANGASKAAQIAIAQKVLAGQGPGAWPVCSRKAGLTRSNGGSSSAPAAPVHQTVHKAAPVHKTVHKAAVVHKSVHKAAVVHKTVHKAAALKATVHTTRVVRHAVKHVNTHVVRPAARPVQHTAHLSPVAVTASGRWITVVSGDCLSKLAATYHVNRGWVALWSMNRAKVSDPNLILVGQKLQLPR